MKLISSSTGFNSIKVPQIKKIKSKLLLVSIFLLTTFCLSFSLSAYNGARKSGDSELCSIIRSSNKYRPNKARIIKLIRQSRKTELNKLGRYLYRGNWIQENALIVAANKGMNYVVRLLLKKNVNINIRRRVNKRIGYSPLMCAAGSGHLETVRILLNHWKKPNLFYKDSNGRTAFEFAIKWENLAMVKLLHKAGARINRLIDRGNPNLILTFNHVKFDVLDYLMANGSKINLVGKKGYTILNYAFGSHHKKWFKKKYNFAPLRYQKKILFLKPRINQVSAYGTALHCAVRVNLGRRVRLLLNNGAKIESLDKSGETPLMGAIKYSYFRIAKYLIKRGANTKVRATSGYSLPSLVIFDNTKSLKMRLSLLKLLLDNGSGINIQNHKDIRMTPLILASSQANPLDHAKYYKMMQYLLSRKADPNFKSKSGRTALLAVASIKHHRNRNAIQKAKLLLSRGANPNLSNSSGETALMLAAGRGNLDLVELLVKKGAKIRQKNRAGETVMSYAGRSGKGRITRFLKARGAKPDKSASKKSIVVRGLIGTWQGKQDGMPHAIFRLVLSKNNSFYFKSSFAPSYLKKYRKLYPNHRMKTVIAVQKGTYRVSKTHLTLQIPGHAPLSRSWKLVRRRLILDNIIRLRKIR